MLGFIESFKIRIRQAHCVSGTPGRKQQDMDLIRGYAAHGAAQELEPIHFERKAAGDKDLLIDILYCGICHADIHQAKNEYGNTAFPLVPGHEIIGRVRKVGHDVIGFQIGDTVGVGYFVDSCRNCSSCNEHEEQFCENGITPTQNGTLPDGSTTLGGYSDSIIVDYRYVVKVPAGLDLPGTAPLLCAGITAYSPLRYWKVGKGHSVAVLGLGGVGHMAVKFAVSFGANVTVLSSSQAKKQRAIALGASRFVCTTSKDELKNVAASYDYIIDTVSASHDYNTYLGLLKKDGVMLLLGVPSQPQQLAAYSLISKRRKIAGSFIGSIAETQQMLQYCAEKGIVSEVEVIAPNYINTAFERTLQGDVHYRFVIDMSKL